MTIRKTSKNIKAISYPPASPKLSFGGRGKLQASEGVVALSITIIVLFIGIVLVLSLVSVFLNRIEATRNLSLSEKAYYAAESGIEDALLRVRKGLNWTSPEVLNFSLGSVSTTIPIPIGGARVITSNGDISNRIRRVSIIHQISSTGVSFFYGAQIGDGGMEMRPNSTINGNVFSNKTVFGLSGGGAKTITGDIIVAGNGNKIDGLTIGQDAQVHTCKDSSVTGTLTYVSGGSLENCDVEPPLPVDGGPNEIDPQDFAITPQMITDWQSDAEAGGIIIGDLTISSDTTLDAKKIVGNLIISNNMTLTMTGTIWVTGAFVPGNNSTVRLDETAYGDLSGVIIVDDEFEVKNGVILKGTSSPSSYLLVIGNSFSLVEATPAMEVDNNVGGAILFTPNGLMVINQRVNLVEATSYQLLLKNNAEITYEIGLENLEFTSGPSGGYVVTNWKEL